MPTLPIPGMNEASVSVGNSRGNAAAMLKILYGQQWGAWIHEDSGLLSKTVTPKKGMMGGQSMLCAVSVGLPQSAGVALGEMSPLPVPTAGSFINPRILARDSYQVLQWTGQSQRAARMGDKAAWARPKQQDIEDARLTSGINHSRQCVLGYYDVLAVLASWSSPTATVFSRNSRTSGSSTARNWNKFGTHFLRNKQIVSFVDTLLGLGGSPAYNNKTVSNPLMVDSIDASDPTAPTFDLLGGIGDGDAIGTVLTSFTPAAGDLIIPYGNRRDNSASAYTADATFDSNFHTFNGLMAFILGSSFFSHLYGLSKTATSFDSQKLSGIHDTNSETQRDYSEMLLTMLLHKIRNNGTGGKPNMTVCESSVLREVVKENRGDRRFAPVQRESGYSDALQHTAGDTTTPYMDDWQCPPGMLWALDSKTFGWYEESPMSALDDPDTRFIPGYDGTQQVWHKSGNAVCTKPHNNGCLDDIKFDTEALTA